jgi:hypothetical protein
LARGDIGKFVIAIMVAPARFPRLTLLITVLLRPECEIATSTSRDSVANS